MFSSNVCSSRAVGGAASQVSITRQEETFQVLLAYLNNASDVINTPGSADTMCSICAFYPKIHVNLCVLVCT